MNHLDPDQESFWARLRETGALRRHWNEKASRIPPPDFSSLWSVAVHRKSGPVIVRLVLSLSALASGILLVLFLLPPADGGTAPGASVVDQVFRSTSHWEAAGSRSAEVSDPGALSSVLKTIDAGFSRWDDPHSFED